jgi:hypothetical protein
MEDDTDMCGRDGGFGRVEWTSYRDMEFGVWNGIILEKYNLGVWTGLISKK